jgi:hypothetical protein
LAKIRDLTMLSDIFPTGYHGAKTAGVTTGSTVYVAGAGPVGLAAAYSAQLLGAAVVIVGDLNADRLKQAESFGCETVDISADGTLEDQIANILNTNEVDCAIDAVGFEASGHGHGAGEQPAAVLNSIMTVTRAGGALGIPGLYVTGDPGASDADAKDGTLKVRLGLGWAKSHSFATGQCPVLKYNRGLMMSILYDKAHIADAVNATVIKLEDAPQGYAAFDSGVARNSSSIRTGWFRPPESPPNFARAHVFEAAPTGVCGVSRRGGGTGIQTTKRSGARPPAAAERTGAVLLEYPVWMWHWAAPDDDPVPWQRRSRVRLDRAAIARKQRAAKVFRTQLIPHQSAAKAVLQSDSSSWMPRG